MKKILVFVNSFNYGGITSLIQDIYRNLDRTKYRMSFVRLDWNRNEFDDEVIAKGDKVYYINNEPLKPIPLLNYYIRQKNMVKQIVLKVGKTEKFDTAYIHANADYCVSAAKALGIKNIIMHSHEALSDFKGNENQSKITAYVWKKRVKKYNKMVSHKLGDSLKAITAKFGNNVVNDPKLMVVHPPINMDKFNPDNYGENELNIETDKFNMIHVGRLCAVKNQKFLVDILSETVKIKDSHLYIVGEGDSDKAMLTAYAEEKGVADKVTFLKGDTSPSIYKAMNCSLLPSFSEAFGMVAVESQLMGVPCFASTNVPTDVDAGMCKFIDLEKGANHWAKEILAYDYDNARLDEEKTREFEIGYIISKLEGIF